MVEETTFLVKLPLTSACNLFASDKVELAGFEWNVTGKCLNNDGIYGTMIHCAPLGGKQTSIWKCDAWGEIQIIPRSSWSSTECVCWSHSYDFRHEPRSSHLFRDFGGTLSNYIYFEKSGKQFIKLEISLHVNMITQVHHAFIPMLIDRSDFFSRAKIHLSDPVNEMIQSSEDAAKVVVEGETLWVSKSILGAFSPLFKALFNSDFKEKREGLYELEDVKLAEFKHFVSLLYGFRNSMDVSSVEYILRLADMYQCSAITNRCHDFLISLDKSHFVRKLQLADRYGLPDVAKSAIQEMTVQQLKRCMRSTLVGSCSSTTIMLLMDRLKDLVKT